MGGMGIGVQQLLLYFTFVVFSCLEKALSDAHLSYFPFCEQMST
jgi:hypothetical protein